MVHGLHVVFSFQIQEQQFKVSKNSEDKMLNIYSHGCTLLDVLRKENAWDQPTDRSNTEGITHMKSRCFSPPLP
jgi:hypothetical protein